MSKVPHHDLEAEAAVLSAIFCEEEAFERIIHIVSSGDFYSPAHRTIFEAFASLRSEGKPIDVVTVVGWLRSRERLVEIGGIPFLTKIVDAVPHIANLEAYATMVQKHAQVRNLVSICQRVASEGYGQIRDVQEWLDQSAQLVTKAAETHASSKVRPMRYFVEKAMTNVNRAREARSRGDSVIGIPTGYEAIDATLSGLREGNLYYLAARPGMGKSSLAMGIALNVALTQRETAYGALFLSLEMPGDQLATRAICSESPTKSAMSWMAPSW